MYPELIARVMHALEQKAIERGHPVSPLVVRHLAVAAVAAIADAITPRAENVIEYSTNNIELPGDRR